MTRGTKKRIDFPDLLDQLAPRSRRNAPRLRREMLDDFNRRVSFGTTPLLRCCRGIVRGLLLCLLCTLPALAAHLVGIPAVNGDLRASANQKCETAQLAVDAALIKAIKLEGAAAKRAHALRKEFGRSFIDAQ